MGSWEDIYDQWVVSGEDPFITYWYNGKSTLANGYVPYGAYTPNIDFISSGPYTPTWYRPTRSIPQD